MLKKEDFLHIQKVIEIYSKVLLAEMRAEHLQERKEAYNAQDWSTYG